MKTNFFETLGNIHYFIGTDSPFILVSLCDFAALRGAKGPFGDSRIGLRAVRIGDTTY
ncbi:MAG: hypothetical protein OEY59_02225 [Deltaproteobacteria bacterium]|nr:hypothetical protein [Deltaproteobacteria bacterium]